jgi:hypothetical protein
MRAESVTEPVVVLRGRQIIFAWLATVVIGSLALATLPSLLPFHHFLDGTWINRDLGDAPGMTALLVMVAAVASVPATALLWGLHRLLFDYGLRGVVLLRYTIVGQIVLGLLTFGVILIEEGDSDWLSIGLLVLCYLPVGTAFLLLFAERSPAGR